MAYALITGAAKGIGKAIAEEMAARNYNLLLVDIDEAGLAKTAQELNDKFTQFILTLNQDLSKRDAAETIWKWTQPYHKDLNVVINNAGYGLNGPFEKMGIDEQLNIIDVNIRAQLTIAYSFIPLLKTFKKSYLLNVGSTTCYQSVPFLSIYAASKAFVISFTRSLRYELRNTPISVSCLSPGSTDTDFVNRARMPERVKKQARRYNMRPQKVAQIAVRGMFNGKSEIVPGFTNKLNAFLPKFFPKKMVERIAGRIYEPKEPRQDMHTPKSNQLANQTA